MNHTETVSYLSELYEAFNEWKEEQNDALRAIPDAQKALITCLNSRASSFLNHVVNLRTSDVDEPVAFKERAEKVSNVGGCPFLFPSKLLTLPDMLSDSGTSAMTTRQWGAMMQGDEAYGSNTGYLEFMTTIKELFGDRFGNPFIGLHPNASINDTYQNRKSFAFLTHQGRSAEAAFFQAMAQVLADKHGASADGDWYFVSNSFFDTTGGHILNVNKQHVRSAKDGSDVQITFRIKEFPHEKMRTKNVQPDDKFLGNMDANGLSEFLEENAERTVCCFLTITNNTGGNQPVSLAHMGEVSSICEKYDLPLWFDACRCFENAYFIQRDEHPELSIGEITHRCFAYADAWHSSLKKDAIVNMGGCLVIAPEGRLAKKYCSPDPVENCLAKLLYNHVILYEGHVTYGGLAGRDILAICQGLRMVSSKSYLEGRIGQVHLFGKMLYDMGVPVLTPFGGSAIYIDMDRFMGDENPREHGRSLRPQFYGNSLVAILLAFGIRACELGAQAFSSEYGTAPHEHPEDVTSNFVRLAIPRQVYSDGDLFQCALVLKFLYEKRDLIRPSIATEKARAVSLHHFSTTFKFKK